MGKSATGVDPIPRHDQEDLMPIEGTVTIQGGPGWLEVEIEGRVTAPGSNWRDWAIQVVCSHLKIGRHELRNVGSERVNNGDEMYDRGYRFLVTIKAPEQYSGHYYISNAGAIKRLPLQ